MSSDPSGTRGWLRVVAGPIGNLDDLTPRAARALAEADLVVAEDTRRTRKLLAHLGIDARLKSLPAAREGERVPALLDHLERGETVALVTDAGTPVVSDPGAALVRAALAAGHRVEPLPGPSALTAALSAAGAPSTGVLFLGFLPRKGVERRALLEEIGAARRTVVLFESPRRLHATLRELGAHVGSRRMVLCRELTKLHEEIVAGSADEIAARIAGEPRGEITLVIDGATAADRPAELSDDALRVAVKERLDAGLRPSEAARAVAADLGLPRRRAYALAVELADPAVEG